ncbi:MAG: PH domain-containing protein [Gammaproteobacteria bacterium]|nr:PH domain-containing protein [Gammaproteobacteria bacterium]
MIDFNTAIKEDPEGARKTMAEFTGDDLLTIRKQLHHLPETLMENEQVLVFCYGYTDWKNGLLVLTDRRIMFLCKGMLASKLTSIPIARINSLSGETGMVLGKIIINEGSSSITIKNVHKKAVNYFVKKFQEFADIS